MTLTHTPVTFDCAGDALTGIVTAPRDATPRIGVVIVVGGPQTRVGSHRAFLKLAAALATRGMAVLRFDTRGMGDSHGEFPGFAALDDDTVAAIAALKQQHPSVEKLVLWGLCDGASAMLIGAARLSNLADAMVLVNPWVHEPEGSSAGAAMAAQVQVKHYYAKRAMDPAFWKKLLGGGLNPVRALREFLGTAQQARASTDDAPASADSFVTRMRDGWMAYPKPVLVITAGDDLVAQEWLRCTRTPAWAHARSHATDYHHLNEANHTFSTAAWRAQVETWTADWIAAQLIPSRKHA
jgi:uncharacterized protein